MISQIRCTRLMIAFVMIAGLSRYSAAGDLELWRIDCGRFPNTKIEVLSDTFAYAGKSKDLVSSCYLIRHGQDYMLWDTGFTASGAELLKATSGETLKSQLSRIGVEPERISIVGISHWHPDHTGQAAEFPGARLLIGKADFEFLAAAKSPDISPWIGESARVEKVQGDKDVFGDGSVMMMATPGHTLGHYSLLIRLPKSGPIILSGDLWHIAENLSHNGVPPENVDRAATLASMDRILKAAANLKATIIIQHETGDISKLPVLPASAK